ncbi:MAG TPA: FkbM family methyltransferase [Candidatus Acidoferrales bacterium]|jgi:hypothetical protein|nr:FkbM family methyltransferase [Candidatus Acidoferrales bacterium]
MSLNQEEKIRLAASCRDMDHVPRVADAGKILTNAQGKRIQVMHNGIQVLADGYYSVFLTELIERLKGHHEPQEEKVFYEILKLVKPGSAMIELGAYWSFYSLWFQSAVQGARNIMVEPEEENLRVGRLNFELNGRTGTFIHALVGSKSSNDTKPPTVAVDDLMKTHSLDRLEILHADIQGAEHEMLLGGQQSFAGKKIRFVFISTHGTRMHARCLGFLRKHHYHVIVEHTTHESFSNDGLIVATADPDFKEQITISHHRSAFGKQIRSLLCRLHSHFTQ